MWDWELLVRKEELDTRLRRFEAWLDERKYAGIYVHPGITFAIHPDFGFFVASFNPTGLDEGTVVARIPKTYVMSTRTVSNPAMTEAILSADFNRLIRLTVAFMYELSLQEDSGFFGYFQSINIPDVPRLWSDEDRRLLEGTEIYSIQQQELVRSTSLRSVDFIEGPQTRFLFKCAAFCRETLRHMAIL